MTPLVSIIIPLYNRLSVFEETIHSVLNQTYQYWECLIVDDHSTDGSYELALKYSSKDNRIKVFKRKKLPRGAPECRNEGLKNSTGAYIIFLDSDDLLVTSCIETRIKYFHKNPTMDFIVFPTIIFREKTSDLNLLQNIPTDENDLNRFIKRDNPWFIAGPIWKKEFLQYLNGFDTNLPSQQDYDLHVRALFEKPYYKFVLTTPDNYYRISKNRAHIGKNSQSPEHLKARKKMIAKLIRIASEKKMLTEERKVFFSQYLLHIGWMWSWHHNEKNVLKKGLEAWEIGWKYKLFTRRTYFWGGIYILWKHLPFLKKTGKLYEYAGKLLENKLNIYIFRKSRTIEKVTLEDFTKSLNAE